jgi:hypothetical protein
VPHDGGLQLPGAAALADGAWREVGAEVLAFDADVFEDQLAREG